MLKQVLFTFCAQLLCIQNWLCQICYLVNAFSLQGPRCPQFWPFIKVRLNACNVLHMGKPPKPRISTCNNQLLQPDLGRWWDKCTNVSIPKQWLKTFLRHNSNHTTQRANTSSEQQNNKLSYLTRVTHILPHLHASA